MSDSTIAVTAGAGVTLDVTDIAGKKRSRMVVGGDGALAEIATVGNAAPASTAYGLTVRVAGQVAHDAADTGESIKIGSKAVVGPPSAVTANDRVQAWFDLYGQLHTVSMREALRVSVPGVGLTSVSRAFASGAITAGVGASLVPAGGSGVINHVIAVSISGNVVSAAGTPYSIKQASGGGTIVWAAYLPAFGAFQFAPMESFCESTANAALFVDGPTGTIYCSVLYFGTQATL